MMCVCVCVRAAPCQHEGWLMHATPDGAAARVTTVQHATHTHTQFLHYILFVVPSLMVLTTNLCFNTAYTRMYVSCAIKTKV